MYKVQMKTDECGGTTLRIIDFSSLLAVVSSALLETTLAWYFREYFFEFHARLG